MATFIIIYLIISYIGMIFFFRIFGTSIASPDKPEDFPLEIMISIIFLFSPITFAFILLFCGTTWLLKTIGTLIIKYVAEEGND